MFDNELFYRITQIIGSPEKMKGDEYIFRTCPFCKNTDTKDEYKFYLNRNSGQYKCYRLNTCGETGNLLTLAKHLNIDTNKRFNVNNYFVKPKETKNYKIPEKKTITPEKTIYDYFQKRGISSDTVDYAGIKQTEKGWISYEYKNADGLLTFRKFRSVSKKEIVRESETRPILYLMNLVNPESYDELIITEGEEDCLALHEVGWKNAVSLPSGASDFTFLDYSYEYLDNFKTIIIWFDNDQAGQKAIDDFIKKVGIEKVKVVRYKNYKDANEVLLAEGYQGIFEALMGAKYIEIKSVFCADDFNHLDNSNIKRIKSSIKAVNQATFGGYPLQSLICWTGFTSSGKTTFLNQEVINFIANGEKVAIYSREFTFEKLMKKLYRQCHNEKDLKSIRDEYQNQIYYTNSKVNEIIKKKFSNNLFVIKNSFDGSYIDLVDIFKTLRNRYDVRIFIIDNLMTLLEMNKELYGNQTDVSKYLSDFAKINNGTVHLVAHQKKPDRETTRPSAYGILGSSNIPNLADMIIGIERIRESEKNDKKNKDAYFHILKDREEGIEKEVCPFDFVKANQRFVFNYQEESDLLEWSKI